MSNWILITALAFLFVHVFTNLLTMGRMRGQLKRKSVQAIEPTTIIRPVKGLEYQLERCLETTFRGAKLHDQIVFCIADERDEAVPLVQEIIARYPMMDAELVIGDTKMSGNPKLNNVASAYAIAKYDWVLIVDSNVLLPRDYVDQLFANWEAETGLVSSPAQAKDLQNFSAHFEAAFLNINQAPVQLVADDFNMGFAQGKLLFWKREVLEKAGGLKALATQMAEDVASTKAVRSQGLSVRLLPRPVTQPLGKREFKTVWQRQVRWAKVRRVGFPLIYFFEFLNGAVVPAFLMFALTMNDVISGLSFGLFLFVWYFSEWVMAIGSKWSARLSDILAWILRDILLPLIWLRGYFGANFEWRGNEMTKSGDQFLINPATKL